MPFQLAASLGFLLIGTRLIFESETAQYAISVP